MANAILDTLMTRDEMSGRDAHETLDRARREINEILYTGGSYDEIEEYMLDELGLEMDYIFDLL